MEHYNGIPASELIIRYANNYGLNPDNIDIGMVIKHWELEKALTKQLLISEPSNRKKIFYEAYNTLYNELTWLAKSGSGGADISSAETYDKRWRPLLKDIAGKYIYEVGSGNGHLINYLAQLGALCIGTEISENRLQKTGSKHLAWHNTDGVNLTEYEPEDQFNYVISDQVIEHLHPDDLDTHFRNVNAILKKGGAYIFYTPHYYIGPGDISLVFKTAEAEGMHLKEYKYEELFKYLKAAGFKKIVIPLHVETNFYLLSTIKTKAFLFIERGLEVFFKNLYFRKRAYRRIIKYFGISQEIIIIAEK